MPIELNTTPSRLSLRDAVTDLYSPENIAANEAGQINASTQFGRGWISAGMSEDANSLLTKARSAYEAGDHQSGAALESQGRDLLTRSQQWAPTVQNITDVTGLRSGMDWAGGALGNLRSSVKPFVGGVAGTAVGALAAPLTGGALNPVTGARIGSALAGGQSEYEEAVGNAMMDRTVRATRSMQDIDNAAMVKGGINSALEGLVPFGLTKSLLSGGGKKVAEAVAEKRLAGYVGSNVAKDMAEEGATEAAQSLVGQGAQNSLLNKDITDFDYKQALNEGAAGAIAGGGMGLVGAGGEVAHAKLGAGLGAAKDTVNGIKEDPFGKVLDAGVNLAGKAGQKITELEHYLDNREQRKSGKTQDEIDRETFEKVMGKPFTSAADPSGVEESHLPASELVAKRKEQARAEGWDGTGDWLAFSRKQKEERDTKATAADTDEFLNALEGKKSKSSMMRPPSGLTEAGLKKWHEKVADNSVDGVESTSATASRDPAKKTMTPAEREQTDALKAKLPQGPEHNFGSGEAKAPVVEKASRLANVLVNIGYKENLIRAATTTTARDQDVRKVAGILNWGAEYGFNRVKEVVPAMVKQFGGKASSLFRKAYDAGVSEGLFPRNDEKADQIEAELSKEHKSSKMLGDLLIANLRPTARAELERHGVQGSAGFNAAVSKLISEVRRVVNTGAKGNELTQTGNVKNNKTGLRNVNDDMVMRTLFGSDEKNVGAILQGFYSDHLARKTVGLVNHEQAEAPVEDYRPEYEAALGESGNEARAVEKRTYHGEFHNINKADSTAALESAEGELKGAHGTVHRVGMKTALLDQYATAHDTQSEDLSPHQRTKALEGAVLDYWPELADKKPGGIQPTANDATKRDYKERSEKWQKTVEAHAKLLERNMKTLMTSNEEQTDAMPNEFDMVAIKALRLDRDLDHPNNSPEMGTLAFKLKAGGTFITSAPMLMRKMHQVNALLGDNGSYHADLKGGKVQNASSILMEGITSLLGRSDYFTGEFGYVKGGEFVAMKGDAKFPADFRVVGSKENGGLITWGDSQQASKDARADLQSRNEEVRETGQVKVDATSFDKVEALKAALRTDGIADKIDTDKLAAFLKAYNASFFAKFKDTEQGKTVIKAKEAARTASRSAKEIHKLAAEIAKLKEVSDWNYQRDQARAEAKAAEPRIKQSKLDNIFGAQQTKFDGLLDDWVAFTFPKGLTVTDMVPGKPDTGTQVDGLQADNPTGEIVRDKNGRVQTSNLEMAAQTGFGTSKKMTEEAADPVRPTKTVVAWDQTEARNWAANMLNKGVPAFAKAIEKHAGNADAQARIDAGLFHLSRMSVVGVQGVVTDATKEQAAKIIARAKSLIGDKNVEVGRADGQAGAAGVRGQVDAVDGQRTKEVRPAADKQTAAAEADVGNTASGQSTGAESLGVGEEETAVTFNTGKDFKPYKFAKYIPVNGEKTTATRSKRDPNEPKPPKLSNPLSLIIKLGGIDPSESLDLTGDKVIVANRKRPGLFNNGGLSADGIREALHEAGWINDNIEEARALIDDIYRGEEVVHPSEIAELKDWEQAMQQYEHEKAASELFKDSKQKPTDTVVNESSASGYSERTKHNANSADVTIAFAADHNTAGERLTARLAGNKLVRFERSAKAFAEAIVAKLKEVGGASLNVAGNGIYTWAKFGKTQEQINTAMFKILKHVKHNHPELNKIVTGGQTGSDIAGAIAARALGMHVEVTMPKGFLQRGADGKDFTQTREDVIRKIEAGADALAVKPPKLSRQKPTDTVASDADQEAARDHIFKTVGAKIEVEFVDKFADGASGKWTPQATQSLIQIALNGDVLSTAFHESFHEFMDILEKHGGGKTLSQIERVAMMPMMQAKLDRLLNGHPEAQAQLKKPDEAAAFMYQFWMAGKLNIGPETKTAFQKFTDMIKSVLGLVSKEVRNMRLDEIQTEKLLKAFSNGAMVNVSERQAVVDAMNASVEANEAAQVRVGKAQHLLNETAGKLMFSAEAMLDATDNKYMGMGSAIFHQKAGTAMKAQTLMDATRQQTSVYMNQLENTLMKYEQADLEMARHGLSVGKRPTAKAAGEAYDAMKGYFKEMAGYLEKKQVKRLDIINGKPTWVNIDFRKDYWPQVWDMDVLEKNVDQFRQDLLDNHADILAKIAADANAEVKARKGAGENTASQVQIDAGKTETITPAMIADSLIVRLMHTGGQIDIEEDLNDLGITPMAAAVNRRKLDWLDAEKFDKYKSKDIAKIMTTYTVNMVKRAEYQDRLGPGGEVLRDINDKAILFEMAGKKDGLVRDAERELPAAIESWSKAAAKWHEDNPGGEKYPEPYPTLRSVGSSLHRAKVGGEKAAADNKAALKHLEQGFKAFQAMEGTLGREISPNFRQFSSWMVTYQNFTKLSTMLFTSFQDVMGIVANGGEMNDAWNAFVSGIKEIKNSWTDKKDTGRMMSRAELWGAVDAGSFADAVGQAYGSPFMSANARRLSDKFFKYTGAEGWNRGVRGVASQVAERTILEWKQHGVDMSDQAAKARVERLFGKGFDVANIKLDADGNLDITDAKNQAAVTRWVLDAVPTTSAAHRPIWGSDPHYQMFIQFKNYTYSFHRILLKGAVEQAKLGNYRPALVLALGYMPIAIAGGAIKEMLIPGEEPPWMKGGLDGYLSYGFSKAGVLGVPQMYAQNLYDLDPAATFGPTIDQIQNVMSIPLFEQRTLLGEGLGALPGGNLLRRAA